MNPLSQPVVLLDTGLFEDRDTLLAAARTLNIPETHQRTLDAEIMNDSDWDDVLSLVLSAKRVITV